MKKQMKKHLGIAGLLFVMIIWGSGFVATDIAITTLTPSAFMFLRFLIAAVLMSIISLPKLKNMDKGALVAGILSMESLFGTIFSVLTIHDKITGRIVMGCILILLAVLILETKLRWWFPYNEVTGNNEKASSDW